VRPVSVWPARYGSRLHLLYGLLTAVSDSESFNPYESVDGMLVRGLMVVAEVGGEVTVASSAVD
jgi:hypothetical protein